MIGSANQMLRLRARFGKRETSLRCIVTRAAQPTCFAMTQEDSVTFPAAVPGFPTRRRR